MALTLHKREALSIAFDRTSEYCVTTSKDRFVIVYQIDDYYKTAKPILEKEIHSLEEPTLSAIAVAEYSSTNKRLYIAVACGQVVEVFAGTLSKEVKDLEQVLRIEEA